MDEADAEYELTFAALPGAKCPTCGTTKSDEHEPGCVWLHEYPWPAPEAQPAEVLSRLTASPLPEIARFVAMIRSDSIDLRHQHVREEIAVALQRMAQEVERLRTEVRFTHAAHDTQVDDKDTIAGWLAKAEARIAELEAELARIKALCLPGDLQLAESHMKLERRIAELEAAAKAPLPGKIADLIERLTQRPCTPLSELREEAAAALQRLAQEVERLKTFHPIKEG